MAPITLTATTTPSNRSFLSSLASMPLIHALPCDGRSLFDKSRKLRALVGHEHRDQFGGFGVAGICRDQMRCPRRLEEGLPDLESLNGTARKLRADLTPGDISGDRTRVPVRAGKSAGAIEHARDRDPLARHIRQSVRGNRLDGIEHRSRGIADRAKRYDNGRDSVHRDRHRLADHERESETGNDGDLEWPRHVPPERLIQRRKYYGHFSPPCLQHYVPFVIARSQRVAMTMGTTTPRADRRPCARRHSPAAAGSSCGRR